MIHLNEILEKVLAGESVKVGIFNIKEDFLYIGVKDAEGKPQFNRVISMVYFDEEDDDYPSTEDFDGTLESLQAALDAHDACDYYNEEES